MMASGSGSRGSELTLSLDIFNERYWTSNNASCFSLRYVTKRRQKIAIGKRIFVLKLVLCGVNWVVLIKTEPSGSKNLSSIKDKSREVVSGNKISVDLNFSNCILKHEI